MSRIISQTSPQVGASAPVLQHSCGPGRVGCLPCAGPLFRGVVKWLRGQGIMFGQQKLHLSLVDCFDGVNMGQPGRTVGLTDIHVLRVAAVDVAARATDVRIVRNLRPLRFQVIAAHELGHVWLANQKVLSVPMWCSEGFCELVAYRFAEGINSWEARLERARISANPDSTYGGGFRRLKAACDRVGFGNLCEALRTDRLSSVGM